MKNTILGNTVFSNFKNKWKIQCILRKMYVLKKQERTSVMSKDIVVFMTVVL